MIPMARAAHAGNHKRVVMVCAAQSGKTETLIDLIGARLDQRPAPPARNAPPAQASIDELISQPAIIADGLADRFEAAVPVEPPPPVGDQWRDEVSFTLAPGEGTEIKLVMEEGASADFYWSANGAVVNYDTHGDGGGRSVSYEQGRGVPEQDGVLVAEFTGNHGWFWRNRTDADVTMTLRTRGAYSEMKRAQ